MANQAAGGQRQEPTVTIEFNQFHINVVLASLKKRPLEEVIETFGFIMQRLDQQQQAQSGPQQTGPQAPPALPV